MTLAATAGIASGESSEDIPDLGRLYCLGDGPVSSQWAGLVHVYLRFLLDREEQRKPRSWSRQDGNSSHCLLYPHTSDPLSLGSTLDLQGEEGLRKRMKG